MLNDISITAVLYDWGGFMSNTQTTVVQVTKELITIDVIITWTVKFSTMMIKLRFITQKHTKLKICF